MLAVRVPDRRVTLQRDDDSRPAAEQFRGNPQAILSALQRSLEGTHDPARHAGLPASNPGGMGVRGRFGVPAVSGRDQLDRSLAGPVGRDVVHVYEAFDLVDEISLEIVLCKYIGTHPSMEQLQN